MISGIQTLEIDMGYQRTDMLNRPNRSIISPGFIKLVDERYLSTIGDDEGSWQHVALVKE